MVGQQGRGGRRKSRSRLLDLLRTSNRAVALRVVAAANGLDRRYNFRALRHSAVTNAYRASKNLFLAQRFARHSSPLTTIIYTHPADEELAAGGKGPAVLNLVTNQRHRPSYFPLG